MRRISRQWWKGLDPDAEDAARVTDRGAGGGDMRERRDVKFVA